MKRIAAALILASIICTSSAFADKDGYHDVTGFDKPTYQKDRRLPQLRFRGNALVDVIDFCKIVTGADIRVDWQSVSTTNVGKNTPVSLNLKDKTLPEVLQLILDGTTNQDSKIKLAFYDDGQMILIATEDVIALRKKDHPAATTGPSMNTGK